MSPARSWRSASHNAGSHEWLPPKNWGPGIPERQDKVDTICTFPLDSGTPTTRRLYPFGAVVCHDHVRRQVNCCCCSPSETHGRKWGDSNFQILTQNCQFHHRRLESLEHSNVLYIYIYHSEHYRLSFLDLTDAIFFTRSPFFVYI